MPVDHSQAIPLKDRTDLDRRKWLAALAALGGIGAYCGSAAAQSAFAGKIIRLVCPYGPGSPVDIVGRYMASCTQNGLGEGASIILENIPGAGGITGTVNVLRAPADGLKLLTTATGALYTTQLLNRRAGFDAQADFVPIWGLSSLGTVILVDARSPYKTIADLVSAAKAQPGKVSYGSAGVGSTPHINTEMFMRAVGVQMTHVPYKSSAAAINDILGGHVDCLLASIASSVGLINEGRMRGLAVLKPERVAEIGQVPTLKESGLTDWMPPTTIFAMYTSSKVPAALREQLATAAQKGFEADSRSQATLKQLGLSGAISGAALVQAARSEGELLRKAIQDAGIPQEG